MNVKTETEQKLIVNQKQPEELQIKVTMTFTPADNLEACQLGIIFKHLGEGSNSKQALNEQLINMLRCINGKPAEWNVGAYKEMAKNRFKMEINRN